MIEAELRDLLSGAERPIEPPDDLSREVEAAMLEEFRRASQTSDPGVVIELDQGHRQTKPRPQWPLLAAAVVLVLVGVGIAIVNSRGAEDASVTATTPSYSRACVDFRAATSVDDAPWYVVIHAVEPGDDASTYFETLADAADRLATAPRTEAAREHLLRAAELARGVPDPDAVDEIEAELDEARRQLARTNGIPCLDQRNPPAGE